MLALLLYPLRKHVPWMRGAGSVSHFGFDSHMALGLIGPTLILYHANFGLGSANSNVALWSMLIVAGSGLVGRFFYAKDSPRALRQARWGPRVDVRSGAISRSVLNSLIWAAEMLARIDALERKSFESAGGVLGAAVKAVVTTSEARRLRKALHRRIKSAIKVSEEKAKKWCSKGIARSSCIVRPIFSAHWTGRGTFILWKAVFRLAHSSSAAFFPSYIHCDHSCRCGPFILAPAGNWRSAWFVGWAFWLLRTAQTVIERLVSPGPLTEAHAKYEKTCNQCHTAFDKNAQASLCLDCHKDVAKDFQRANGLSWQGARNAKHTLQDLSYGTWRPHIQHQPLLIQRRHLITP